MRKNLILKYFIGFISVLFIASLSVQVQAKDLSSILPGLKMGGYVKNESYAGMLDHRPRNFGQLMSSRNIFTPNFEYHGLPHLRFFTELRLWYDAVFDLENKGTGAYADVLADKWEHNFDLGKDDWDPFLREAYVDITYGKFEARLGRQIEAWGKSDGVYMLDVINRWNLRNPMIFEEEDIKIPNWMVNLKYWFKGDNGLQLLFWPRYIPHEGPGLGKWKEMDYHDWTFQAQGGSNNSGIAYFDELLKSFGVPEGFPVIDGSRVPSLSNASWGLRWSGYAFDTTYTINFLYTWAPALSVWGDTRHLIDATKYFYRPDRISTIGFSFDRGFPLRIAPLQVDNFVLRGEFAYTRNQPFYAYDFELEEKDTFGYMLGFDTWIFTKWLFSIQLWQDWIINPRKWNNVYGDAGINKIIINGPRYGLEPGVVRWSPEGKGGTLEIRDETPMGLPGYIANGKRDALKTQLTAFTVADILPQKTLHPEFFMLWDPGNGDGWFRAAIAYDWNDYTKFRIGTNWFWGSRDGVYGEFRDRSNFFVEIKLMIN